MDKSNQIKFIKAKLALLDAERKQLLKKLDNIERETFFPSKSSPAISINSSIYSSIIGNISESSQGQQIKLFSSLFRGRDDVFASCPSGNPRPAVAGLKSRKGNLTEILFRRNCNYASEKSLRSREISRKCRCEQ